jgi:aspartyl-tRNA(Asn)/glutamyl-tRNA(Gln) amidotransferase subunit C
MPSPINKKTLEYLAELARIELNPREEEKLLKDLQKILDYFEELKTLDTKNSGPIIDAGGLKNVFREDEESKNPNRGAGVEAFPETQNGYLKIPPVFE